MKLQILGSSSSGNSYILTDNNGISLGIECGVNFNEIKKALDFDLSRFAIIQSHSHGDHSKSTKDALINGVNVFSSNECFKELGIKSHRAREVQAGKRFFPLGVDSYHVIPFDLVHDVRCFGFLINHSEMGTTVFITDTMYVPNTFKGLNNVIIEANYSREILDNKLSGMKFLQDRIKKSHLSLENAIKALEANDLTQVNNILLIHLSDSNSCSETFKSEVYKATGKNVIIADAGMEIEFNKTPF